MDVNGSGNLNTLKFVEHHCGDFGNFELKGKNIMDLNNGKLTQGVF
jgi:hypothetical protein